MQPSENHFGKNSSPYKKPHHSFGSHSLSLPPSSLPLEVTRLLSLHLPVLDISYKWNDTTCVSL